MRVLHITSEFTKKNYSISSLILSISTYLFKNFKINYSYLACKSDKILFTDSIRTNKKLSKWSSYFLIQNEIKKIVPNHDCIHIHGIWAPIQLFSIIICNKLNLNFTIHPHGMLLPEALRSAGNFKFFFKFVTLFILKKILTKKLNFIAITKQEHDAIKKYFPSSKITNISNPNPFNLSKLHTGNKKKKFIYLGRIHPHKNLDLLINAFLEAKLGKDWFLEIYGIRDDEIYFDKLKKLIANNTQIKIKDPVFNEDKQKIMNEAWMNVLISKSEVVSLSILESSANLLPSLINKEFEITGLEDSVIKTNLSLEAIRNRIVEITKWPTEKRLSLGKTSFKNIEKSTSLEIISHKYKSFYEEFFNNNNKHILKKSYLIISSKFKKYLSFLTVASTYTFNLMFPSLIVIMLVIKGDYSIAGELGLTSSFWLTLTQIFSSNVRSLTISDDNKYFAITTTYYRIFFSMISLIIFFFIPSNLFNFENIELIYVMGILVLSQWINEMYLVQLELKNKIYKFIFFTTTNILTIILALIFIYNSNLEYLFNLIFIYIIYILTHVIYNLSTTKKNYSDFISVKKENLIKFVLQLNLQTIAFLSSFTVIISSLIWKITIYFIFDKSLAAVYFACFSIGSFPGTLFNSVIGPNFIKKKITVPQILKKLFVILFIIIVGIFIYNSNILYNQKNIDYFSNEFIYFTTSLSLIGSYFMSYAMYFRHKKIQASAKDRYNLFKIDFIYGISLIFLIPILYYFGGAIFVSGSYLMGAIIALFFYYLKDDLLKNYIR